MDHQTSSPSAAPAKKCLHCGRTKTPQWRAGPIGRSTLCNTCGVRYRSGYLYPGYHLAKSPALVAPLHSSSLKKVLETRIGSCEELQTPEFMSNDSHLVEQDERNLEAARVFRGLTAKCCNSDQLKDSPLDPQLERDNNVCDSIDKQKEKFALFVASERKSDSSKFVEYWVPVRLSNVQLEQYCATLLSNSTVLRSCSKSVTVQALRDVLISNRKCCDHPYIVDISLQNRLMKGLSVDQYLDVGVNASGKLKVLDKTLSEIKKWGLRVLIVFQSISGSGKISLGDILDDFLRQRFGEDSYERVDSGLLMSKKQAAMNKFNDKERGRFVFLIENRACLPSIKLSSIDIVILYDSDWNPSNDLRALQRITIESQYEQLKVFRLYSSCTLEEKVLTLAKQDMTLDSNVQNIHYTTTHMLLKWGAPYLFKELDEFHGSTTLSSGSVTSSEQSMLNVVQDLLTHLPQGQDAELNDSSVVLKVKQTGMAYSRDTSLPGELEMKSSDEELPHVFWTKLLDRRSPQWRYLSAASQRVRKKVQHFDGLPLNIEVDVAKKRRKVANSTADPKSHKALQEDKRKKVGVNKKGKKKVANSTTKSLKALQKDKRKVVGLKKEGASGTPVGTVSQFPPSSTAQTDGVRYRNVDDFRDVPETQMVEWEERRDLRESQKNLHTLLKPKMSKLYEILRIPEDVKEEIGKVLVYISDKHLVNMDQETILQAFQISLCWAAAYFFKHKICHKETLALAKQHLNFECEEEEAEFVYDAVRKMLKIFFSWRAKRLCKLVKKIHNRRMRKLSRELKEEHHEFLKKSEELVKIKMAKLVEQHKSGSANIRSMHKQVPVIVENLKLVDKEFRTKVKELNYLMEMKKKKLESMQQAAMNEEKRLKSHWLREANSGRPVDIFSELPLSCSGFRLEDMDHCEQDGISDDPKKAASISEPSSEEQITDTTGLLKPGEMPRITVPHESVEGAMPTEPPDVVVQSTFQCTERDSNHDNLVLLPAVELQLPPPTDPPSDPLPSDQFTHHEISVFPPAVQLQQSSEPLHSKQLSDTDVSVLPPDVQLKLPPPTDSPSEPLLCNHLSNHDISVLAPAVQLQLPPPTCPLSEPLPSKQLSNTDVSILPPAVQLQLLPPSTGPPSGPFPSNQIF